MYDLTRQQASEILWISLRSVDRYIKSWKIRAKKSWKTVLLNKEDIMIISWEVPTKQKIITQENKTNITPDIKNSNSTQQIIKKSDYEKILWTFEKMYNWFREEIKQKDEKIQELSMQVWILKEKKNNSIDLIEYKKMQFLSEEDKKKILEKLEKEQKEKEKVLKELKYEKTTNKLLIFFLIILFIVSAIVFFMNI